MYLKRNRRLKDGKEHFYWNVVESKRCSGGKVVQRQVLYLGEINDSQREAWCRVIDTFDEGSRRSEQLALFPADRTVPEHAKPYAVQVRLEAMQLYRPRQWGACVDLSQVENLSLYDLATRTAFALDNIPIEMLFAVLQASIAFQIHAVEL